MDVASSPQFFFCVDISCVVVDQRTESVVFEEVSCVYVAEGDCCGVLFCGGIHVLKRSCGVSVCGSFQEFSHCRPLSHGPYGAWVIVDGS